TGVQTCALPICLGARRERTAAGEGDRARANPCALQEPTPAVARGTVRFVDDRHRRNACLRSYFATLRPRIAPAWSELKKWKPTRTRARLTSSTTSLSRAYSRVVPVIRLSSEKCTLSVPKKARSALVPAPLWQACAEGY